MSEQFVFRAGARVTNVDAEIVGTELTRICEKNGGLRPADVVEEARPEDAPLHPAFEWNDSVAAEAWRVHTARHLIRSVQVVSEPQQERQVFVNVQMPQGAREYQPMSLVVSRPDLYATAIFEARSRIVAAQKALDQLQQAAANSDVDAAQLAAINIAMQALATASGAIQKLH